MRRPSLWAAAALLAIGLQVPVGAHDIPRDVIVHAFLKPEGDRLRLLLRVPLGAMRDIQFPQHGDGSLDVARAEPFLQDAVEQWLLPGLDIREGSERLESPSVSAVRISLPSDRSFSSYDAAVAHVMAESPQDPGIPASQALLDIALDYQIRSDRSAFSIKPGFERLGVNVVTVLRYVTTENTIRAFQLRGDPGLVRLDPRWHEAAWHFVKIGFFHILDGADHLLFLLCLVIPFRRLRPLIIVVTAFTAAHSVALIAAAWGVVPDAQWFPPLVEMLIAASVLYMAIENVVAGSTLRRRGLLAFGFGLLHGFGFSFALTDTMQFAGSHLLTSLFSFNVGVELGQILVLLVLVPALTGVFRFVVRERIGTMILSVLVAHVAWHWMADRWSVLREFPAPALDAALALAVVRILIGILIVGAAVRLAGRGRQGAAGWRPPFF
ncbi:MAG: HupE/UreJ family protein [Vicinamibacterales bacterium]